MPSSGVKLGFVAAPAAAGASAVSVGSAGADSSGVDVGVDSSVGVVVAGADSVGVVVSVGVADSVAAGVSAGVAGGVVVAANAGAAVSTAPLASTPKAIVRAEARLRDEENEEAITQDWPDSQVMSRRLHTISVGCARIRTTACGRKPR